LISEISSVNENLKSFALINRGDSIGNDNTGAIDILKDCPYLTCLPMVIGQRKAFANAATDGMGVVEMRTQDKKAVSEIQSLYQYIFNTIA
jgi:chromosome partitioning protein